MSVKPDDRNYQATPTQHTAMKKQFALAVVLTILPLMPAFAQYRDQNQQPRQPQISVSGSAEVKVAPDQIFLYVGLETRDRNLEKASQEMERRVVAIRDFLKRNGVNDKDVQTDYISIKPEFADPCYIDYRTGLPLVFTDAASIDAAVRPTSQAQAVNPQTGLPMGNERTVLTNCIYTNYVAQRNLGIKLTQTGTFEKVLTGLLTNGVNSVHGIDLRVSEIRKYKDQARAMAVKAAKEKAEAAALILGVKVGKPLSVDLMDWGGWSRWNGGQWEMGGRYQGGGNNNSSNANSNGGGSLEGLPESDDGALSVGQISVSANVNVTFLIK